MRSAEEFLEAAQAHLNAGAFPDAKAVLDEALAAHPRDPGVRELFANLNLAHGIRLAGEAREMRRRAIEAGGRPGEPFEDPEGVRAAFRAAVAAFDDVLAVDPVHLKALTLKAQAMFRLDRGARAEALALYDRAIGAMEAAVAEDPSRAAGLRNLARGRRQIEAPCEWCDDTGFCTECTGGGWRAFLGLRRKCEACLGHGICRRCGVL